MHWHVEIKANEGIVESHAQGIARDITDLQIKSVSSVDFIQVYVINGNINESEIKRICDELLCDPVTHHYTYSSDQQIIAKTSKDVHTIEIAYNPGVMDPVEASTIKGIRDLGIEVDSVHTAKKYIMTGKLNAQDRDVIVNKVLSNKLIQHEVTNESKDIKDLPQGNTKKFDIKQIDILGANDRQLMNLSQEGQLFLNLEEMQTIKKYFQKQKRNPTDCELETIAQTWSEHCNHKTFRGNIEYTYKENGKAKTKRIRNLLKSTIVKATQTINKPWCVSVFHDNAGVIKFDQDSNVCFKVETHNHPSALEPFGGANTGVGGVIRDTLGTGLGAKPICNTDVFCFAPPDMNFDELPSGALHPKRILKGVVSGVRDYGNKMGIPTVNGAILFDERFVGNPLVYCGNVGIMPKDKVKKVVSPGDVIVAFGGRTGRDGIHGATFSSGELTDESEVVSSGAVQIGDPIQEKKVLDVLLKARDEGLYTAITDCGAGGFSSAVGEMGQNTGARVDLENVSLKYQGLSYTEMWISESQERMVIAVPKKNVQRILDMFAQENVEAQVLGEFTNTKRLELFFHGAQVCDLNMEFLHDGVPKTTKKAKWTRKKFSNPKSACPKDLSSNLLDTLSHYNVCSKEWVIRQYDHEVQAGSVIKPLVGVNTDGPSDASVVQPKLDSSKGVAVSNGINVRYGMIDPFWMAASCIDEALRQIVAVGGSLDKIAILDNFCWGNPDKADRLGSLVRCAEGCYKTAVGYKVPFISGKDSLYNEFADKGKSTAIPGTILISAIGIVGDIQKTVTMDLKKAGNLLYIVGPTFDELGGSIYWDTLGTLGNDVPQVNMKLGTKIFETMEKSIKQGLVRSAHDCSEGGLGVALAEMAFSGGLGVTARLDQVPYKGKNKRNDHVLFSESNSRFVVEIEPRNQKKFEAAMKGIPHGMFGRVEETPEFIVYGLNNQACINANIDDLKQAWQSSLKF